MDGLLNFEKYRKSLSKDSIFTIKRGEEEIAVFAHPKDNRFWVRYFEIPQREYEWQLVKKHKEELLWI